MGGWGAAGSCASSANVQVSTAQQERVFARLRQMTKEEIDALPEHTKLQVLQVLQSSTSL